ncbi:MAG: sugar ABC transporter permease [Actinomycetota bacterium]|nr:sugar ABC transporter permease [Actinomycetota bacterium]MED5328817.1 sugar ABC transporter permease [Actinomycetota bacterium]MED6337033.1 sugar ABC transporter permease [Actinomycetota bacterium]
MDRRTFAGFTIPSVLIMVMLMAVPLITTVYLSFNRIFLRDLNDRQWIGFENYTEVLSDPAFWDAFKLTILFVAIVVPAHLVLGFGLATLLDRVKRGRSFYMAALLLPFIVTPVVGTLMVRDLFDRGGLLAWLWNLATGETFVIDAGNITWILILHGIWATTPFVVITLFAGMQTLPPERLEASEIDGAGFWAKQRFIVIPHLRSLIIFILLISIMDSYRVFDSSFVFGQSVGESANTLTVYNFEVAFRGQLGRVGKGNAVAVLTMIGMFVALIPFLRKSYAEQIAER